MSELMTQAIIGMSFDMAMDSEPSRRQFYDRAQNMLADYDAALAELAEEQALRERMAELLSQSAVALRGPEPPLTRYNYADIPSRVKAVVEELAALKGGREAVTTYMGTDWPAQQQLLAQLSHLEPGTDLFTAPPAQASAWAPEGWRQVIRDLLWAGYQRPFCQDGLVERCGCWRCASKRADAALAAAPTPGASDGKGGE